MCAYTQKALKLSKMLMDLGHTVYFYGGEGSEVECTEFIEVISNNERKKCYGEYDWRKEFFKHEADDYAYTVANVRSVIEINKRKQEKDILLITFGNYQKRVSEGTKLETVESGIGYEGVFSKYRVFESYAWMHHVYGLLQQKNGSAFDCVIPNYFYPEDFPFVKEPDNYFLFIGRLVYNKGLVVAVDTCKKLGVKLVIAGQGNIDEFKFDYKNIEFVGSVGPEERSKLMGNARAVFVPTLYVEPFGGVAVEAQMCGTPVITSDWGAFTETVLHGITGYRCRTLDDFVWSAKNISNISREKCREWAISNYSVNRVAKMYDEYFHKIMTLWDEGWYKDNPERTELDWLKRIE